MTNPIGQKLQQSDAVFGALVLLMLQVVVAAGAGFYVYFLRMSTPHCTDACDYEQLAAAINGFLAVGVVLLLVSAAGIIALRERGRTALIPPILGTVATILIAIISGSIAQGAMSF